jgi:hypothetical protein
MCDNCDRNVSGRLGQAVKLLTDPVFTDRPFKEELEIVYHAVAYEIHTYRIRRIKDRRRKHGKFMNNQIVTAKFMHELEDL